MKKHLKKTSRITCILLILATLFASPAYAANDAIKSSYTDPNKGFRIKSEYANFVERDSTTEVTRSSNYISNEKAQNIVSKERTRDGVTYEGYKKDKYGQTSDKNWSDYSTSYDLLEESKGSVWVRFNNMKQWDERTKSWKWIDIKYTVVDWNKGKGVWPKGTEAAGHPIPVDPESVRVLQMGCSGTFPSFSTFGIGNIKVKAEFFKAGTNTPVSTMSPMTFEDVDDWQGLIVKVDGHIENVHTDSPNNGELSDWKFGDTGFTFGDIQTPAADRDKDDKDAVGLFYSGTGYTMQFFSTGSTEGDISNLKSTTGIGGYAYYKAVNNPDFFVEPNHPRKYVQDDDEFFSDSEKRPTTGDTGRESVRKGYQVLESGNGSESGGTYSPEGDANVFSKKKETIDYKIDHYVSSFYSSSTYFTKYMLADEIDPIWDPANIYMGPEADKNGFRLYLVNDAGLDAAEAAENNSDVPAALSSANSRSISDETTADQLKRYAEEGFTTVLALAKNDYMKSEAFYGRIHRLYIKVRLNDGDYEKLKSGGTITGSSAKVLEGGAAVRIDNDARLVWNDKSSVRADVKKTGKVISFFEPPKPKKEAPYKRVTDDDGVTLTGKGEEKNEEVTIENTIDKVDNAYHYHIYHRLLEGYSKAWYFDSYRISDRVPDILSIQNGAKVFEEKWSGSAVPYSYTGLKDVTEKFDIAVSHDRKTITASAKASALSESSFYDHKRYHLRFDAKVDREKYKTEAQIKAWIDARFNGRILTWKNKANVAIGDEPFDYENESDTNEFGKKNWNKDTNEVTTHIQIPKPKKNAPNKQVTDNDNKTLYSTGSEKRVIENTIVKPDDTYTYHIRHRIGSGKNDIWDEGAYSSYWYFKTYGMTDTVEDLLLIDPSSVKVYEYSWSDTNKDPKSGETDVTNKFNVQVSANKKTVSATAKADALKAENFYNVKLYELRFNVKVDTVTYKDLSDLARWKTANTVGTDNVLLTWNNKGDVAVTDNADPKDPGTEDGKGSWDKDTNNTTTHVWIPVPGEHDPGDPNDPGDPRAPGLLITKIAEPYEFQVGEAIPYTITIREKNPEATAYKVYAEDIDFPEGFTIEEESLDLKVTKGEGRTLSVNAKAEMKKAESGAGDGFIITADYLEYGDVITLKFKGFADKTLNGTIVPNTVRGRAWGTHNDDKSTWNKDDERVYINSPKMNVTKETRKDEYGSESSIHFKTVITNENPGTFMRNVYAVDTSETDGLVLDPNSIEVQYNTRTDSERLKTLRQGTDYVIERYDAGKAIPVDFYLGSRYYEDYDVKTAAHGENEEAEKSTGTGAVLPAANKGGFVIKFLGKYRNLGYMDKTVPATDDVRGKTVQYLSTHEDLVNAYKEDGITYTTDYADLSLQNMFVIRYDMTADSRDLAGEDIRNFIRVPATENTNNDMIADDDDLPEEGDPVVRSGGDYAYSSAKGEPARLTHEKDVNEEKTSQGETLHYILRSRNASTEEAKDVVIKDGFTTGNAEMNEDVKVILNKEDITDSCSVTYEDKTSFRIELLENRLKPNDELVIEYTAKCTSVDPEHVHNETVLTSPSIEKELRDEEDVPCEEGPEPGPEEEGTPEPEPEEVTEEKDPAGPTDIGEDPVDQKETEILTSDPDDPEEKKTPKTNTKPEPNPEPSPSKKLRGRDITNEMVRTGDERYMGLVFALVVTALASITLFLITKKRKRRR